jgi:hypothetical protein
MRKLLGRLTARETVPSTTGFGQTVLFKVKVGVSKNSRTDLIMSAMALPWPT